MMATDQMMIQQMSTMNQTSKFSTHQEVTIEELLQGKKIISIPTDVMLFQPDRQEEKMEIEPKFSHLGYDPTILINEPNELTSFGWKENINLLDINKRYIFDSDHWIDCGNCWLNKDLQGNRKFRLLDYNFGGAIGKNIFYDPVEIAGATIDQKSLTKSNNKKFHHKNNAEIKACKWYCRTRNVEITETVFIVPKWEPRIGVLFKGNIKDTDGMIEIKNPYEMYESLSDHIYKISTGWKPQPFYHDHIWENHYAQMQGIMKITDKKWCDYIVHSSQSNLRYVERILFNQEYWDNVLWPGLQHFLNNILEPLLLQQ